jgi:hypothetical protein
MNQVTQYYADTVIPGIPGIKIDIPNPGGFFEGGLLGGLGTAMQIALGITLAIWVIMIILAAITIIRSNGESDKIKQGITKIKTMLIASSILGMFFVVLSLVGSMFGFGTPADWGNTLSQCGGYSGPFYFVQVDMQRDHWYKTFGIVVGDKNPVYCCSFDASQVGNGNEAFFDKGNWKNIGIKEGDTSVWYLQPVAGDSAPADGGGLSGCHKFGSN